MNQTNLEHPVVSIIQLDNIWSFRGGGGQEVYGKLRCSANKFSG